MNGLIVTYGTTPRLSAETHSSHTAWAANGDFAGQFEERRDRPSVGTSSSLGFRSKNGSGMNYCRRDREKDLTR